MVITFDGDARFRWCFNQWKAESQGFPSVKEFSKMDITIISYDDFEIETLN